MVDTRGTFGYESIRLISRYDLVDGIYPRFRDRSTLVFLCNVGVDI